MSTYTDKFFSDKQVGSLWDVAVSIKRGNPLPLDKDAVVHGLSELNTLANSSTSYPGQIVAVVIDATETDEERIDIYYLDHNKSPKKIGTGSGEGTLVDDGSYVRIDRDATFQDKYISGIKYAADGEYENGLEYYRDKTYHAAPVGFVKEYVAEYVDTQLNAIETLLEQI